MHFEINVSKNGHHVFATAEHSARDQNKARELYALFVKLFPEAEGYSIRVTRWDTVGTRQQFNGVSDGTQVL
jgi:hypothetical protein